MHRASYTKHCDEYMPLMETVFEWIPRTLSGSLAARVGAHGGHGGAHMRHGVDLAGLALGQV